MLFQITHICFSEPDNVTLHSAMNIIAEAGVRMIKKWRNNGFSLLISGICQKMDITNTP